MHQTLIVGLLATFALVGTVANSDAARFRRGEKVRVAPEEIVDDDLYASGADIRIEGTVTGDLVAAGGDIYVRGAVNGSVIAAGGKVTIEGPVGGTVRAAGGKVILNGRIGHDAMLAGGEVHLEPQATIGRDLVAGGGRISVADTVGNNAKLVGEHLRLEDGADIVGNLDYGSENVLFVGPGAGVRGDLRNHSGQWKMRSTNPQKHVILSTWRWTRRVMGMFMLGLLLVVPFGSFTRRTLDTLGASVFGSLLLGFAMVFLMPLAAGFLLILGVIAGGWWLGFFALALWVLAMMLGYVVGAIVVGRWTVTRLGGAGVPLVWTLLFGILVLALIGLIPILGKLVGCAMMLFGLGALTITVARRPRIPVHAMAQPPEALAGP
jgi:cytoskeletal protein CcmA (bactofilin family)